jgi:hypothetical protein
LEGGEMKISKTLKWFITKAIESELIISDSEVKDKLTIKISIGGGFYLLTLKQIRKPLVELQ